MSLARALGFRQGYNVQNDNNYADPAAAVAGLAFCTVSKTKRVIAVLGYDGMLRVCSIPKEISGEYAADLLEFEVRKM